MSTNAARIITDPNNVVIDRERIRKRVLALAEEISADYKGRVPVLICVLNGSFLFFSDLVRELTVDCEVDFLKISSYGNALKSSGEVKVLKNLDCEISGRDLIVVEDIIDTGLSVKFLRQWLAKSNPASLKFVSLLIKQGTALVEYDCDYVGFTIPNEFVIGYGLDYAQKFRNLPAIFKMPAQVLADLQKSA